MKLSCSIVILCSLLIPLCGWVQAPLGECVKQGGGSSPYAAEDVCIIPGSQDIYVTGSFTGKAGSGSECSLTLYNVLGEAVVAFKNIHSKTAIKIKHLPMGICINRIIGKMDRVGLEKLLLNKHN